MNLLLIDHEDSFTYNLAHLLSGFGNLEVKIFMTLKKNHKNLTSLFFLQDQGSLQITQYHLIFMIIINQRKIIGICLGFQLIANGEGGTISKQEKIFHGYQTYIRTNSKSLRFPNNALYQVGRYHS